MKSCYFEAFILPLICCCFVQSLSHVWLFATTWTTAHQASLSFTNSRSCSNTSPLSQWCHPTISSSVIPFSSCLLSFPASGSFPMSQYFASGGQSIGASASALVLLMHIQDWFPLEWTGWISSQSKGLSRVFPNTTVQSINSLALNFLLSFIQWKFIMHLICTFLFHLILKETKAN